LREIASGEFETSSAQDILIWGIKNFHPRLALSASFGAPDGMVLLDMMHRIDPASRVFVLDTGRLHQSTYDLIDRVRDRYDKRVEVVFPQPLATERMVRDHGMNLFYESLEKRQMCCQIRKVEPMRRKLAELDAYVSGLRRDQGPTRANAPKVSIDESYGGIVKLNPIAEWSLDDVWQYVRRHDVPVNRLHAEGYPSIGCAPCSRVVAPGEDPRAGRWWWESPETKECGLHPTEESDGSGI
jgi:thioredoxin-dependent adenylylsulfate APS reductase